jgi:hypothetical protein
LDCSGGLFTPLAAHLVGVPPIMDSSNSNFEDGTIGVGVGIGIGIENQREIDPDSDTDSIAS